MIEETKETKEVSIEGKGEEQIKDDVKTPAAAPAAAREEKIEKVVNINRVAKVVAGGKRFSFAALVVLGDGRGLVAYGYGKAKDVRQSIEKARKKAEKNMKKISLKDTTIPHEIIGKCKACEVLLKPASHGTGVIAGRTVRSVLEAVGIKDILTKSLRSKNILHLVKATFDALERLKTKEEL